MSYYGDFYGNRRFGDYYAAGDPGIFDFIKRGARVVGGAALGFVTGGPAGAVRGAIGGTVAAVRSGTREELERAGSAPSQLPAIRRQHQQTLERVIERQKARARAGGIPAAIPSVPMSPAGGVHFGRRRHMNVTNVKAIRRAVRRLLGFKRVSQQVMHSLGLMAGPHPHRRAPKLRAPKGYIRALLPKGDGDM